MDNVSRLLVLALVVAFFSGGTALAQNAPPQPATSGAPSAPKQHHQCKQSPQGCHKKKKQAQPPSGAPPQ
jgi:hypothetical protein